MVVASLVIQGPLAILFALLLNQRFKGRALIRTLIFVPYVVSEVIVGTGWGLILQTTGALNALLKKIGLGGADWIPDPKIAIWTLMFIISWKYIGFAVILMIAGMQSIPEDLYEAAKVDGAGFWRQQWSITLPLLGPTIRIWAFMSIIGSLQLFDLVYIIWGQYVSSTAGTSTMATYMVREGRLANNYGYGSAVAVVIFIISLVIALTYQRFVLNRDISKVRSLTRGMPSVVPSVRRRKRPSLPRSMAMPQQLQMRWFHNDDRSLPVRRQGQEQDL